MCSCSVSLLARRVSTYLLIYKNGIPFLKNLFFYQKFLFGRSHLGSVVNEPTGIHEEARLIPGLTQWVKDLVLPWRRLAAIAPI